MIVIICLAAGVTLGIVTAKRRGGKRLDILHYAAGYGIGFTLLGIFLTVIIHRLVV